MPAGTALVHIRPVVDRERIESLVDVQQMLLELSSEDASIRVLEIGRKRLPDDSSDSPNWGFVRAVANDRGDLEDLFGEDVYHTVTQGRRHQSATRVAAEGTWELTRSGRSTYLHLELDGQVDDDLLSELQVRPAATYVVNVKNPQAASEAGLDDGERADLPDELQRVFDGNRWAPVDPPALLEHTGVEFVLVPAES